MRRVLVLNTTYEPLNVCSVRRALVLLLKDKAEPLEFSDSSYHSANGELRLPHVIRLRTYVKVPRTHRKRVSRRAVLARDQHRCQYCGSERHLTVDHVIPRSKGGSDSWENVVDACATCNRKKADRLPQVASMQLLRPPRPPDPFTFVFLYVDEIHESWRPYLGASAVAVL